VAPGSSPEEAEVLRGSLAVFPPKRPAVTAETLAMAAGFYRLGMDIESKSLQDRS
jgi:hypothetical protein